MPWTSSDHRSAAVALRRVRDLAGLLDLAHPDPLYQAGKASGWPGPPPTSPTTCR